VATRRVLAVCLHRKCETLVPPGADKDARCPMAAGAHQIGPKKAENATVGPNGAKRCSIYEISPIKKDQFAIIEPGMTSRSVNRDYSC